MSMCIHLCVMNWSLTCMQILKQLVHVKCSVCVLLCVLALTCISMIMAGYSEKVYGYDSYYYYYGYNREAASGSGYDLDSIDSDASPNKCGCLPIVAKSGTITGMNIVRVVLRCRMFSTVVVVMFSIVVLVCFCATGLFLGGGDPL